MDYGRTYLHTFSQLGDIDKLVDDCRTMARGLGFVLRWKMRSRTATVYLKQGYRTVWSYAHRHDYPHMAMCYIYCATHAELTRRYNEHITAIERMKMAEMEKNKEREVANMPSWAERNRRNK